MIFKREFDSYYMSYGHKAYQDENITVGMRKQIVGGLPNYYKKTHRLRGLTPGLQYCRDCEHRWLQAMQTDYTGWSRHGRYLYDPIDFDRVKYTQGNRFRGMRY